ncbi:MAG: pilus assembly protein TadB, partial [Candidatus Rokuibacteriota bacterium]
MELYYAVLVIAFIAALLAVEALYGMWNAARGPEARRVEQRIRSLSAGGHAERDLGLLEKQELAKMPAFERLLLQVPRAHQLDRLLVQSGLNLSVARFFFWTGVL